MTDAVIDNTYRFFVFEPDPLVRMDLIGLLQERFPGSEISASKGPTETIGTLDPHSLAFTRFLISHQLLTAAVIEQISGSVAQGARVVVIGSPRDYGFKAEFVEKPFKSDMIFAALA